MDGGLSVTLIGLVGVVSTGLAIAALVDAARRPEWVWELTRRRKTFTIMWLAVGILFVGAGVIVAVDYFGIVRPQLLEVQHGRRRSTDNDVIDATVYLNTADLMLAESFERNLQSAFRRFDLLLVPAGPPQIGSWFRRFKVRAADAASDDEVRRRLQKIEQAVDAHLTQKSAEVNAGQAGAIAQLAEAAAEVDDFVALAGTLLFTKTRGPSGRTQTYARMLTPAEVQEFESNSHLMTQPEAVVERLHLLTRSQVPDYLPNELESE